jgi:hypothetical protein
MVLKIRTFTVVLTRVALAAVPFVNAAHAHAQSASSIAPSVGQEDPEYKADGIRFGSITVNPGVYASATYDNNIYADPAGKVDDAYFNVVPYVTAKYATQTLSLKANTRASITQFATLTQENSVAADVQAEASWSPTASTRFLMGGGWSRAVENRGDTEALTSVTTGPRKTDILSANLEYRRQQGRILLQAEASLRQYNVLSSLEDERDFTSYLSQLTLGYRVSGTIFGTATVFANRRDARLAVGSNGINRDASTYGTRLGVSIDPGGVIEGRVSAGLFRFNPDDPVLKSRTGVSVDGALIYHPTRRTAMIFNAFRGNVATFRNGAQSRTDTRATISVEQEVRHNIFGTLGVSYRQSKFIGSSTQEKTFALTPQAEWLVNRRLSVVADASFTKRTSNNPLQRYDRFNAGVSVRFRL